jgi:zinc/manganese transport system substrate-binding protein
MAFAAGAAFAAPAFALNIFACEPDWGALATELGGSDVKVYTATTALQDVHRIQARPGLIAKYRQADLLVCTGADLEVGWLPALASTGNNPKLLPGAPGYFEAARHVSLLDVPDFVDRSMGDVHAAGNPHIQTSPYNILAVAGPLAERMAKLDPSRADAYRARLAAFETKWRAAIGRWEAMAHPLRGVRTVSLHRSWPYLYDWLGMVEVASLEPVPGIPPTVRHLNRILEQLRQEPAQLAIHAAYQDPRASRWLAERIPITVVELPYSVGGAPGAEDLYGLFDVTLERLLRAAGAKP